MRKLDAVRFFGTARNLAQICGVSPQAVGSWGDEIPLLRQYQLEVITKGELKSNFTVCMIEAHKKANGCS